MFAINIRKMYSICDKMLIRNIRSRRPKYEANPGLDHRLKAFKEEGHEVVDDDAEEFIEASASDFAMAGIAYDEHVEETLMGKHELSCKIVKEKYFKEIMPNLLTWSEKEQIRHLCLTQPNEWTPERITESFPVTEAVVKKLIKYPWKPATQQRIERHDASAMRNWKGLKDGTLDIPEEMRKAFLKFSDRTVPPLNKESIKSDIKQEKIGEYEKIIQKCANSSYKFTKGENLTDSSTSNINGTYENKSKSKERNMTTLEELTNKIKKRLESGKGVDVPDQIIVDTVNTKSDGNEITLTDFNNEVEFNNNNNEHKNELTQYEEKEESLELAKYPLRIRIPKKAYKKGATYKVDDCYYDDDGKFLYRVIGMTN